MTELKPVFFAAMTIICAGLFDGCKNGIRIETGITLDKNGKEVRRYEKGYNPEGKIVFEKEYYEKELINKQEFEYDESGNCILEKIYESDEKNPVAILNYFYESREKTVATDGEGRQWFNVFKYDSQGNKIFEEYYSGTEILESTNYEYDSEGRKTVEERYDYGMDFNDRTVYEYDDKGNCISEFCYSIDESIENFSDEEREYLRTKTFYFFDSEGRCIAKEYFDNVEEEHNYKIEYIYDKNNKVMEKFFNGTEEAAEPDFITAITYK